MSAEGKRELEVQEAINRALAAEREASAAVDRAEAEAAALRAQAREQAQQIRRHAEQRATTLHERYGRLRDQRIARRLAAATAEPAPLDPHDEQARIARAVARVAALLTGVDE
jgi:regulator of protease activity HflC (stomatin/prohibitin superfamily)